MTEEGLRQEIEKMKGIDSGTWIRKILTALEKTKARIKGIPECGTAPGYITKADALKALDSEEEGMKQYNKKYDVATCPKCGTTGEKCACSNIDSEKAK